MLTFTAECSNDLSEKDSWESDRPYKFLCGTLCTDESLKTFWDISDFYDTLISYPPDQVYTWNSLRFDWKILYDSGISIDKNFVLNHKDMMFDFFCHSGYPLSIAAVLKGARLFEQALRLEVEKTLFSDYVARNDRVRIEEYSQLKTLSLYMIANGVIQKGGFYWETKSGALRSIVLEDFMTVRECMSLQVPDNEFMEDPFNKEDFVLWLESVK